jgi:hypothetical protein
MYQKSEYRKQREKDQTLGLIILATLLLAGVWFLALHIQQDCIRGNNITLCD